MASNQTDRRDGVIASKAIKNPVKAASTANLAAISGLLVIDGYQTVAGDRILLKNQTTASQNGIYNVGAGTWTRARDCDGNLDLTQGTIVHVLSGTVSAGLFYECTTTGTIVIGTSNLTWSVVSPSSPITLPLSLAQGGTGQTTKAPAASALGIVSVTGAGGTANAQTGAVPAPYTVFAANDLLEYTPPITNTGATTLTVTPSGGAALAAQAIFSAGAALVGGELQAGVQVLLLHDGARLQIVGNSASLNIYRDLYVSEPGGRTTLTTLVPVTSTDVTAAATVYYTPYKYATVKIYNGASWVPYAFSEISIALDSNAAHTGYHQSGKNFDLFVYNDAGTLRIGTGPAWTSDTARGAGAGTTELQLLNGRQTNKNAITLRFGNATGNTSAVAINQALYLATFRTTADGQTEDSAAKRFLWNNYNRVSRSMIVVEHTDSWNYTTNTLRQANGSAANQLDFVLGLAEDEIRAQVLVTHSNTNANVERAIGIGLDSTTVDLKQAASEVSGAVGAGTRCASQAFYEAPVAIGRHTLVWLETSTATGTTTWYGDNGGGAILSGIFGSLRA